MVDKLYRYKVTGKLYRFVKKLDDDGRLLFDQVDPPEKPGDLTQGLVALMSDMEPVEDSSST